MNYNQILANLIGKTPEEANEFLKPMGMYTRTMWKDGSNHMGTCDVRSERIDISVQNGVIIDRRWNLQDRIKPYDVWLNSLIGKTQEEANAILAQKAMYTRVVRVDGKDCGITDDLLPERVDIMLINNVIVSAK